MKYLFVISTLSKGGAEKVVSVLSSALANLGQDVCILAYHADKDEYFVDEKVKIIRFAKNASEYQQSSRIKRILFIRKTVKEERPDFVIPFMFHAALATEIATMGMKVNVFHSIRNNPAVFPPSKRDRLIRNWMVARAKCTFTQNDSQKLYFDRRIRYKIHVLFNPVDDRLFNVRHNLQKEDFVFCTAGRLAGQKNFNLLIRSFILAFDKEENVKLVIYGDGYLKEQLQRIIDEEDYASKIILPGRTHNMADAYAKADAFVLSSDFEGMPNALMEAMAAGVPSISTNCPTGPADLIDDHVNGILVPIRNQEALAAAMRNVYEDKHLREKLSVLGRKKIREICSAEKIARQMMEICESKV